MFLVSILGSTRSYRQHYPNGLHILRVHDDAHPQSVPCLVSTSQKDLFSNWRGKNVTQHAICVKVCELDWEGFKGVPFWNVVFDSLLEFERGERATANSFIFVVCQSSRKHIAQLAVPLGSHIVFISSHTANFVSKNSF